MADQSLIDTVIESVQLYAEGADDIKPETRLLDEGRIDSMNILQIIADLEKRLGMSIGPFDLTFDHFQTPADIANGIDSIRSR